MDLLFVIERLLPGKATLSLYRQQQKHLPVPTLSLENYDTASSVQFCLYKYCPNYSSFTKRTILDPNFALEGTEQEIKGATILMNQFLRGSVVWVEHYLSNFEDSWRNEQKNAWLADFKLLCQTIIGIGTCKNARWLIEHHPIIKALSYNQHMSPFIQHYA